MHALGNTLLSRTCNAIYWPIDAPAQKQKHILPVGQNNTPIYNLAAGMCLAAQKRAVNAAVVTNLCTESQGLSNWNLMA
nr:unnamed protein product [Callosobruchus chinensis]